MEEQKIEFTFKIFKTEELSDEDTSLRKLAIEASQNAYAPYSKYCVGAAVVLEDGRCVKGNNQENAAYPSGLCAERVALFAAGANFPNVAIKALAIIALKDDNVQPSVSPCGACRQVLLEAEQRQEQDIRIVLCGRDETIIVSSAKDLLPLCFGKNNL